MLAQLNGIAGVESSSASVGNPEGALVRVSVRAGADPAKIAAEVQRVLSEAVKDRPPVPLTSPASAAALLQKEWLDPQQLADLAATDPATSEGRASFLLMALLLGSWSLSSACSGGDTFGGTGRALLALGQVLLHHHDPFGPERSTVGGCRAEVRHCRRYDYAWIVGCQFL